MVSGHSVFAKDTDWNDSLNFTEILLSQNSALDQCHVIEETFAARLSAEAHIWLTPPSYPLPGEICPNLYNAEIASQPVTRAIQSRAVEITPGCAAFPIITQDNLLAVLEIRRPSEFLPAEINLIRVFTAQTALAMQNYRQMALKNWRYEQLSLVRSVSARFANLRNLPDMARQVTQLIQETFHFYYVAIFVAEEHSNHLTLRANSRKGETTPIREAQNIHRGEGIVGQAAATGSEYIAPDIRLDPHYRSSDGLPETLSEVAIPLKIDGQILGVLDVQSDQLDAFHEMDLLVLRALADNIALAVEGTRLYAREQKRADQISTVLDVSRILNSILDPDLLLKSIADLIHDRLGYPFVHVFTVRPIRRKIAYRAGSGARAGEYEHRETLFDLDSPIGIIPWVARTGETLLANDVRTEPLYRPADLNIGDTRSELTVPLKFGREILGVLDLQSEEVGAFTQEDQSLIEALASSIAVTMRNATLYKSEQWRRQVSDSFRDVAGLLTANLEVETLLDIILKEVERNLPCDASAIWLTDENPQADGSTPALRLAAVHGVDAQTLVNVFNSSPDIQHWLLSALDAEHPQIRQPGSPTGPLGAALGFPFDYSSIAAPLKAGDTVLGVLTIVHQTSGRYGSEASGLTTTFSRYAAVAIQNARLYAEAQEQAWTSTILLQVAEATQNIESVDDLFRIMARLTPMLIGVRKCAFFCWEPNRQGYLLKSWYGLENARHDHFIEEKSAPAFARMRLSRSVQYIRDAYTDLSIPHDALDDDPGTVILLPLMSHGEILGAVLVTNQGASTGISLDKGFTDRRLAILQGIAHQTSTALENLQLLELRQEEAYVTAVLLQVAQTVVSKSELNEIMDTIIHLLPILVGVDAGMIYLWDRENGLYWPLQAHTGFRYDEQALLKRSYASGEFCLLDSVLESDRFVVSRLAENAAGPVNWSGSACLTPGSLPDAADMAQGSWLIGFPISIKGEALGVLVTREKGASMRIQEKRMEIINGIAQQLALAIQNDRLRNETVLRERLEREVQLARQIQETFLPNRLPNIPGWELSARWQTARQVGGDFYDVFHLGKNRLGLVIADVSDKGMPAALYMTVTRTLIRAFAQNSDSPSTLLERVNRLLYRDSPNGLFVTVIFAILDLENQVLHYTNAGHNLPLLLRRASGTMDRLPGGGIALGVLNKIDLKDYDFPMQPGDALVLYTDGVTESFSPNGEAFGEERLLDVLSGCHDLSAGDILKTIEQRLVDFRSGSPASDDLTLMAVKRNRC